MSGHSSSLTTLRKELERLAVDTSTPGISGDARRDILEARLREALARERGSKGAPPSGNTPGLSTSCRVTDLPNNAEVSDVIQCMGATELRKALEGLGGDVFTPGETGEQRVRTLAEVTGRVLRSDVFCVCSFLNSYRLC